MSASSRHQSRRRQKKSRTARVWLNGREVTQDCFFADDRAGIVRVFLRDERGKHFFDRRRDQIAQRELRGRTRIARFGKAA